MRTEEESLVVTPGVRLQLSMLVSADTGRDRDGHDKVVTSESAPYCSIQPSPLGSYSDSSIGDKGMSELECYAK